MQSLSGRTAFITGASSGLGARFAAVLSAAGAKIALTGRRGDRLVEVERSIRESGGTAASFELDVSIAASIEAAVGAAETSLGPIDILVNNAGVTRQKRVEDFDEADFDFIMDTNAKGAFLCALAVGRRMIAARRPGSIVNIASIGADRPLPGQTVYCMSKAAVAMMTQSLARDWARHGINVNAICPGYIRTELNSAWFDSEKGLKQIAGFPRRRLGEAQDLDGVILLLASPQSRFLTGSLITVDDGQSLV